jgi:hypothetical protein
MQNQSVKLAAIISGVVVAIALAVMIVVKTTGGPASAAPSNIVEPPSATSPDTPTTGAAPGTTAAPVHPTD